MRRRLVCLFMAAALMGGCSHQRGGFTIRDSGDWATAALLTAGFTVGGLGCP